MVEVYVADSAGSFNQINIKDFNYVENRDFKKGDSFEFEAAWDAPIVSGAWVRVEDAGAVIFRGATLFKSGNFEEPLKWACEPIPQLLKRRFSWPMRWGAPPVTVGYSALTIAQVLGSDAPSQAAGVDQYVPGAIWMANSYVSVDPTTHASGVWYYEGWGSNSRAGTKDVYVGGHLCTAVDDYGDLTGGTYRIYRTPSDLWVYGAGVGDYGPVCIDNAFDFYLRLGNIDKSGDYLLAAADIGIENYWQFIEDFLFDMGIYLKLRHTKDYTYLDGSINSYARGSSDGGTFTLREGDWTTLKRRAPRTIPPTALLGLGAGDNISQVRYSRCDLTKRGPWIEQLAEVSSGRLSPLGRLEDMIDSEWNDVSEGDFLIMETDIDYIRPGDWLDVYLSPSEMVTAQVSEVSRDPSDTRKIYMGGKYAAAEYAYFEEQASLAIAAMRSGQTFGSQEDTDNIGPGATGDISWTPTASTDRDTALITVDLRATNPADSDESSLSVTWTLTITNTTYAGGQVIAIIPHQPWGKDPIFEGLDITDWCALDGNLETLEFDVTDPTGTLSETIGYTMTVNGIGRYGQSPVKTLNYTTVVAETLDVDYGMVRGGTYPGVGTTARSRAFIKTNGVKYYGTYNNVPYTGFSTPNPVTIEHEWLINPNSGAAWTQGDLDDLQAGIWLEVSLGGTESGEVTFNLADVAMPAYDFKLVLVHSSICGVASQHPSFSVAVRLNTLRVELR